MTLVLHENWAAVHSALDYAGLDQENRSSLQAAEIRNLGQKLFRTAPQLNDPTYRIASHFARMKQEGTLDDSIHHLIVRNQFLSSDESHNGRDPRNPKNLLHAARVLINLELGHRLTPKLDGLSAGHPDYTLQFERTRSIRLKPDARGVNGCPEALWQLQLFRRGDYVGRVGFNVHREGRRVVLSVVTVQGAQGRPELVRSARRDLKINFGAYLIRQMKAALGDGVEYRGLKNKELKPFQSPHLYRSAYSKAGIVDLL